MSKLSSDFTGTFEIETIINLDSVHLLWNMRIHNAFHVLHIPVHHNGDDDDDDQQIHLISWS